MKRIHIPVKACSSHLKHPSHQWREDKVFLRECNGRTSDKENRASRRSRISQQRKASR